MVGQHNFCRELTHMEHIAENEREVLVAELRERGIRFLAPSNAHAAVVPGQKPDLEGLADARLLLALVQHPDPRLRLAIIPWFILHPEIHTTLSDVTDTLSPDARIELKALYMAAVYLQRLWWTRLSFYLDSLDELPDLFSRELGLPPPDERHGKVGLHVLAEWHAGQSDYPVNRLASYQKVMDLLFQQLKQEACRRAT